MKGAEGAEGAEVEDRKEISEDYLKTLHGNVDFECEGKENVRLLLIGKDEYSCILMLANVKKNNNKYYIIQVHEDNDKGTYYVWLHWGRVGYKGRHMKKECDQNVKKAVEIFLTKFKDKTQNNWQERANFQRKDGMYDLMKTEGQPEIKSEHQAIAKQTSMLDEKIQELLSLICNPEIMEKTVTNMGYNLEESPLGKMTLQHIMDGYAALREIERCIIDEEPEDKLMSACGKYYTKIPHKFGMKTRPPLIDTPTKIQAELNLLESLDNIYIAMIILKTLNGDNNPIDSQYSELKCTLEPLNAEHEDFQMVRRYLHNSHAPTHDEYTMEIMNVFKVSKEELQFEDVGNRQLLWHGSRLTNWAGILREGLRIAPPEAPCSGYMFGKGVYFADRSSKSCNYCKADEEPYIGLALLCEVALGESNELLTADESADQLPSGKQSVKGLGKTEPDPNENECMECGTLVPLGKGIPINESKRNDRELLHNEYVVYDTKQIKMRYLVQIKFNWKLPKNM